MMVRKQFSYPNFIILKASLSYSFGSYFLEKKISKNYSRETFLKMLLSINVHPSLFLWTHDMGVGNGILINYKRS